MGLGFAVWTPQNPGMPFKNMVCVFATLGRRVQSAGVGAISIVIVMSGMAEQVKAAPIVWIGGNANWDAANANWNPADEPDANDEAIFNTPNTVNLANATDTIQALTLSGGIDLLTNGNDLVVDGLVQLVDASTVLIVGGSTSQLTADSVTINSGGTIRMTGGTLSMVEETGNGSFVVNTGGTISGHGTITFGDAVAAGTVLFTLSGGAIAATSNAPGDLFGTAAATLTFNVSDADARIDLDNVSAVVGISRNDTLAINGLAHDASDPYSGTLNLGEGSTLNMSVAWQTDSAIINVNTGGIIAASAGAAATIAGAAFTFGGGTLNLDDIDSLHLTAPFTATAGTINNAGLIIFDAATTIGAGTDFQMTGANASLTVSAGRTVNIDDADFNLDGNGAATNVVTIESGGVLDLDLGVGGDQGFTGVINLNGGELDVTTGDDNWQIDGLVNVGADTGTSRINGEEVTFTSATITVGANALLDINAPAIWAATGNLITNAGAVTRLDGTTVFNNAGTFTGTGSLLIGGTATFSTVTTINMPGGTVDLDGADTIGNTVTVNDDTTINAAVMASFGNVNILGTNTLLLAPFADLIVNLTDPNAEWTLNAAGVLEINAIGGMLAGGGIQGSDFNMNGTTNISGNSLWTARTDITGTVNVALNGSFSLRGGTLTDLNRLIGGTITGDGTLRSLTDEGLAGFGTINTDIDFATNTVLLADDGILNVTGPILDVGTIGTADDDGILNVTTAWNTNVTTAVNLEGGELRGATITNAGAGGITGDGLVSARVINNTSIDAQNNGTLIVETAANDNDWDGAGGAGQLRAIVGNLEVRDNAAFLFTGNVIANQDHEIFVNGFELEFEPAADLILGSGTYRATNTTDFGGTMFVAAPVGGDSRLRVAGTFTFENGSITTLNGNLLLANSLTVVQVGADFSGGGALVNTTVGRLRLADGVLSTDLGVLIINQGQLQIGTVGTDAQVQGDDFQQTAAGSFLLDIGGVALNAFDRFNLTGAAALSGNLSLSLIGGFVPVAGQTFNILTATGGVSGAFASVNQPAGMPAGLAFSVGYSAFIVTLTVTTPYEAWINQFGITDPADRLKSANPDDDELNNQGEFALDGNPVSGASTGKVVVKIAPVGGVNALTLTLPVRVGAVPDPADPAGGELVLKQTGDAVKYTIQATGNLAPPVWTLTVTEVLGADAAAIQLGLPALNSGWVYRTFRSPGPVTGNSDEFMRLVIAE